LVILVIFVIFAVFVAAAVGPSRRLRVRAV